MEASSHGGASRTGHRGGLGGAGSNSVGGHQGGLGDAGSNAVGGAASSTTTFEGWAGEEQQEVRNACIPTKEKVWDLIDSIVIPGGVATDDDRPKYERFASAACGTGTGTRSGFKNLARKRESKQVIYDYSTVQGYSCKKCRSMGQHQLALRPPGYLECVLRAGPAVTSFPDGCGREDDYVVYNEEQKELLMSSGFIPVKVHYFKPDVPLPEGNINVPVCRCSVTIITRINNLQCHLFTGFVRVDGQETRTSRAAQQVVRPAWRRSFRIAAFTATPTV